MSKRRLILLLAFSMMAAGATLTGCSGSGTSASSSTTSAAKTADVSISAVFPGTATTAAVKSLMPSGTNAIYVYVSDSPIYQPYQVAQLGYKLKLTSSNSTGTIKLVPGNHYFYAAAFDSTAETDGYPSGNFLGATSSGGVVNAGSNRVVLTFLNGQWTVVDANNNPSYVELSDNTTRLYDVIIGGEQYPQGYASKAALDFSKPFAAGGGMMRYRFNNNSSAYTSGSVFSQFVGETNTLVLNGGMYNLTQKCSNSYHETPCQEQDGDKMIMIPGVQRYESSSYGEYESTLLWGDARSLLPNGGVTSFTRNGQAFDLYSNFTAATLSDGTTMTGSLVEVAVTSFSRTLGTPASAAKAATPVLKSISTNTAYTGVTATYPDAYICASKSTPKKGSWQFYSQPFTVGTATCYQSGYIQGTNCTYNTSTQTYECSYDAGDFSYGLVPSDPNNLGDYCHQWDYDPASTTYNSCKVKAPPPGQVYYPDNFIAKKTDSKTSISYGSFKFNFYIQEATTGTIYVYPFRAKGSATVTAARK